MEKEKQENILDKMGINFHRTLSFKLIVIGIMIFILLIPKFMILSLINERSTSSTMAENEVMEKWSKEQIISGPALIVPFKTQRLTENNSESKEVIQTATFLPQSLSIQGVIHPKELNRSIYKVNVYEADLNISGKFGPLDFQSLNINEEDILWEEAELQLGLSDLRGISEQVFLTLGNEQISFSPGMQKSAIGHTGISIAANRFTKTNLEHEFKLKINVKGSKKIRFIPLGETTNVRLESLWNDPGFTGNFLPNDRKIDENGFSANWKVLHFNRNFPQQWINYSSANVSPDEIENTAFGVELVSITDHYQKTMRSAKYAILIIIVTFIVFFLYEVFSKQRIHPFQYILVGSAICVFYLLLLSLAEQFGFNIAYLSAALAVTLLVFLYSRSFMPKFKNSVGTTLALVASYAFIFVLLQIESFALLAGSIGLFILLALLMYFTRKINWYNE